MLLVLVSGGGLAQENGGEAAPRVEEAADAAMPAQAFEAVDSDNPPQVDPESLQTGAEGPATSTDSTAETDADAAPALSAEDLGLPQVLDLETAQLRVLMDNPGLRSAQERVLAAQEVIKQARSLYFPNVDVDYAATKTWLSPNTIRAAQDAVLYGSIGGLLNSLPNILLGRIPVTSPLTLVSLVGETVLEARSARDDLEASLENYQASLTVSYILFNGFARKFGLLAAKYGALETEAARREAQRLLLDAVAQAYYEVQLARENIAIAVADEGFNVRQLEDAQARRRVGTGSLSDVLNFEIRVREARSQRLRSERGYAVARVGLAALMGLEKAYLPEDVEVSELESERPDEMQLPETEQLVDLGLAQRPDLKQDEFARDRADANVGAQRAPFLPQVTVFGSKDAQLSDNSRFETDDFGSTVGVSVNYNLFAGGRNRAALAEAKAQRRAAEYLVYDTEIEVASDVRQAVVDLKTAQQELILQRATTEYVQRNRDLVEKEYDAGQASLTRLNEAQRDLIAAQSRLALARVALRRSWHALQTATAETLARYESLTAAPLAQKILD
ncbi:MAG: TolC family protein [Candidatus Hydrogenedentes bacterium]|nr:TolC family protein [Candidatus Hydrogenedentota bacterium]